MIGVMMPLQPIIVINDLVNKSKCSSKGTIDLLMFLTFVDLKSTVMVQISYIVDCSQTNIFFISFSSLKSHAI